MGRKIICNKRLWIAWNTQRRNETLSEKLGAEFVEFKSTATNVIRYPFLSFSTLLLILSKKPKILFAQNPSLVLAALVSFVGKVSNVRIVIDAHNAGIFPLEGRVNVINKLALIVNRQADVVIVSNENLKKYLEDRGAVSVAVPDPIPLIKNDNSYKVDKAKFNVVYVCSWSSDEPYLEVIQAAEFLDESFRIYITGKGGKDPKLVKDSVKDKVSLTGYLTKEEYESLLCSCDAIMVLTERENCLVCGAYEGVAAEKPLILSDKVMLRSYFDKGSVYTQNLSKEIAGAIVSVKKEYQRHCLDIVRLKVQCKNVFMKKLNELDNYLMKISID